MSKQNRHDEVTDRIRRVPQILGIENTLATTGEVILFEGHRFATSPDNLIFTSSHKLYVVEYKASDRKRKKDFDQLRRHLNHVKRLNLNYETIGLYVYGSESKIQVDEI